MKRGLHPRYEPVAFRDRSTGEVIISRSTRIPAETIEVDGLSYRVIHCDVTADSHPFWTGKARSLDSEGRIERFRRRYAPPSPSGLDTPDFNLRVHDIRDDGTSTETSGPA